MENKECTFLKADYKRAFEQTSYQGELRKTLHVWTSPGFQAIAVYRINRWLMQNKIPFIGLILQRWIEIMTGICIPPETKIGPGLFIHHFGGIVINSNAQIGENCDLHHGVTIGNKNSGGPSPAIGDRVTIGVGAVVLGGITIGNDVEIGANAVVVDDIPDHSIVVGIPGKVIKTKIPSVSK